MTDVTYSVGDFDTLPPVFCEYFFKLLYVAAHLLLCSQLKPAKKELPNPHHS